MIVFFLVLKKKFFLELYNLKSREKSMNSERMQNNHQKGYATRALINSTVRINWDLSCYLYVRPYHRVWKIASTVDALKDVKSNGRTKMEINFYDMHIARSIY